MTLLVLLMAATPALGAFPGQRGLIAFEEGGSVATIPKFNVDPRLYPIATGGAPAWSADGTSIAYVSGGDLWIMNADGSGKRRVGATGNALNAAWSPDGARIVYSARYQSGEDSQRLNVVTLGGGSDIPITTNGRYCGSPTWSPAGDLIAYSCAELYNPPLSGIWTVRPDGTGERQITFPGPYERDSCPDWKPDSSRLIYHHAGQFGQGMRSVRPDGGDARPIGPETAACAQWAPEGTGLVYSEATTTEIISLALDASFDGRTEYRSLAGNEPRLATWQPVGPPPEMGSVAGTLIAGAPGGSITVDGGRFVPRSVVRWNGAPRPTTYVGPTRLVAQLSTADLADPGSGEVTVFTSPTGGGLSAARTIPIVRPPVPPPPPPGPKASITGARFTAVWRQSVPRGWLRVSGRLERGGRVEIALLRGTRIALRAVLALPAGDFSRAIPLRAGLLPGRHTVRVHEIDPSPGIAALTAATREAVLPAPAQGVVARAAISTTGPHGPAVVKHPGTAKLYARFSFAARPAKGRAIVTQWFHNGVAVSRSRITRPFSPRVDALIRSSGRLPRGRWRCVISAGGAVLAATSVRIG